MKLKPQLRTQLDDQLFDQLRDQLRFQLLDQLDGQLLDLPGEPFVDQLWRHLERRLCYRLRKLSNYET